jgi:cobalt-zinc-cadmium efflux system outer membrane protein
VTLYRDALIPKVRQTLEVTQRAFETGQADFLSLIDAQRTLLEFSLTYERAVADHAQRLAEMEMLAGKELAK